MKKLRIISEKIETSNNNYFGRGSFETIIKNNKDVILSLLENLTSIQNQIRILNDEYECENLQKRNYVRILTKLFPDEYNQFVCLNILLRDIDSITLAYLEVSDLKSQYKLLTANNKLKFPGKHQKFVDFDIYQQFITLYANDLIEKSQDFETEEELTVNSNDNETENKADKTSAVVEEKIQTKPEELLDTKDISQNEAQPTQKENSSDDKTNWMNVLLKGI